MLHISPDEQKERLLARLDDPAKLWKYSSNDLKERAFWNDYMDAYQKAFEKAGRVAAQLSIQALRPLPTIG
jgi:polyphosphate kinase 2 (PPK2 family)